MALSAQRCTVAAGEDGQQTVVIAEDIVRIGQVMPDYEIERELGRGGMGIVFLGRHRRLRRGAAIKELPPSFAAEPEVQERFATEAQTLAGLEHPHIVPIFDYVERDGLCLIVMQELPGGSVWDRFSSTGLTPPTACAVVMACCAALQHAHDKGVLHLDVKPDNLMFDAESAVKVTDFGISRVITGGRTLGTVDGQVLGTPAYMSPEQARGDDLTAASDVYAAGVMLYELLSGQLPWHGAETAAELLQQRLNEDPIPLREQAPAIPQAIADVVMTSLSRDVEDRYQRAEDFGVAIGEACVDSWGPGWLDHAGVALVGSERLSLAARTTSHHSRLVESAVEPVQAAVAETAVLDLTEPPATGAPAGAPGARATGATSHAGDRPVGAAATGAVTPTEARPAGAAETGAVAREGAPGARETIARQAAPSVDGVVAASTAAPETTVTRPAGAGAGAPSTGARPPAAPATGHVAPVGPTSDEPPPGDEAGDASTTGVPVAPDAPAEPTSPAVAAPLLAFEAVRAASPDPRIRGVDLADLELADLISVEDVLNPPRTPWRPVLLTALAFAVALLVALIGLGSHDRSGTMAAGQVTLADVDVTSDERIDVDLSQEVVVQVADRSLAGRADEVEIGFTYLDIEVSSISAALRDGVAVIDPGFAERAVGGAATADVRIVSRDEVVANQHVGVQATQNWLLTAPFATGVLLILLAYAELETSLKPLRSGHSRKRSYVGAAIWCPVTLGGVLLVFSAWGRNEISEADVVAMVVLGVFGGITLVRARIGVARRRRVRTAVKRAEKRLGVHVPG